MIFLRGHMPHHTSLMNLFQNSESSLTVEYIKDKIGRKNDKATIYRALYTFENSGLIFSERIYIFISYIIFQYYTNF